jgi:hypothetical protein
LCRFRIGKLERPQDEPVGLEVGRHLHAKSHHVVT